MKNKLELMESANIKTALLKLGLPTMVGMVVSAFYNLVDTFFIGRLGTLQMAALTVIFPVTMIGTGLGLLFANGGSVFISQKLGRKEFDQVTRYLSTVFVAGLTTAAIVISIMLLFFDKTMFVMGATAETLPYIREYGFIFIIGLILNVFNLISNNIINTEGATTYSMTVMFAGGALNVVLDPILIFGLKMGIEGAAIATLLARLLSMSLYLYYFLKKTVYLKFSFHMVSFDKKIMLNILKIGIPVMSFQLLNFVTLSLVNVIAGHFGNDAIAAVGIVNRIFMVEMMLTFGFIKGYQPFIAYNYGQKKMGRIQEATSTAVRWLTIASAVFAFVCILFSRNLISAFDNHSRMVVEVGSKALLAMAFASLFQGYCMIHATCFLSMGKAKKGGFLSVCQQGVFFIPLLFLLSRIWGLNGLISTQLVTNILMFATTFLMVRNVKYA
ncbi:MAG: MATE family efflux transporter [Bacteroidales bacterium]|jgi:putative MATE family efflux protein|nr:MATE family efflux transporter [Bacteroidales bacterium]